MRGNYQFRRKLSSFFYSRFFNIVLVLLVIMLAKSVGDLYQKNKLTAANRERVTTELKELERRRDDLEASVARLQTDRGLEWEIRQKFPVVKEGERVITVVDQPIEVATTTPEQESFWRRWFGFK
jgi:cell division protein FtsB